MYMSRENASPTTQSCVGLRILSINHYFGRVEFITFKAAFSQSIRLRANTFGQKN